MDEIIPKEKMSMSQLEEGIEIRRFDFRKKPEEQIFRICEETRHIILTKIDPYRTLDGAIDMKEIKQIEVGKDSKDFEKWPADSKKLKPPKCFVIHYGSRSLLKTISISVATEEECELCVQSLRYLVPDTIHSPYPRQVKRWLRKEFNSLTNRNDTISLKVVKAFFSRIHYKISTDELQHFFNEVDIEEQDELGFEGFVILYQKLMSENVIFKDWDKLIGYSANGETVNSQEFQNFLLTEQRDPLGNVDSDVSRFMEEYLQDPQREIQEPYFTVSEFIDFLYSKQNQIWDSKCDEVRTQQMDKPLCHYWIASSHNTYLTGHQLHGESSCQAYARALRAGCRCIELDCWNGPDGSIIYHGHTATTKIKFSDVLKTIKEHAFVTSEYPVILSIEDHCTLAQQRKMASEMHQIFGEMLVTERLDASASKLPSPYDLRRRILLKHGKLPHNTHEKVEDPQHDDITQELDLRNTSKSGILYMRDETDEMWNPHFFVLTEQKLYYTDTFAPTGGMYQDEDEDTIIHRLSEGAHNDELHYAEEWFHGTLEKGRVEAEEILQRYAHFGDGTFLVRNSGTFIGDYSISFWFREAPHHCRIKMTRELGRKKFYFVETKSFDSLYSLITYYRIHPISQRLIMPLTCPAPQPSKHEEMNWWRPDCSRNGAEELLKEDLHDGVFLVRPSDEEEKSFAISFRAGKRIKHCRIKAEGRLFSIGVFQFESLVRLISHYETYPLYKNLKLVHAVGHCPLRNQVEGDAQTELVCASLGYMDPSYYASQITVKALFEYVARADDELSFSMDSIITNVNRGDGDKGWWRGDFCGRKQFLFPAHYVVDVEIKDHMDEGLEKVMVGNEHKGSFDIAFVQVELIVRDKPKLEYVLAVMNRERPLENAALMVAPSLNSAQEWKRSIEEAAKNAGAKQKQNKEMEQAWRIAKEISDLTVYCCAVPFDIERIKNKGFVFNEMSSFRETRAEKLICQQENQFFIRYHQFQFSRVYPVGYRFDSSNYNPVPFWNSGSQMVALNYQTGDKPMQLNYAKFRDNGNCGYLLKPDFMFREDFDPYDKNDLGNVDTVKINLTIISGRNLTKPRSRTISPFVEVEVVGADFDSGIKLKTNSIMDNGFNPVWDESCEFEVANPYFAMLRFLVQDKNMFENSDFLGQATFPIRCLRTGYRSVPLKNIFSEDSKLATILVHINITIPPRVIHYHVLMKDTLSGDGSTTTLDTDTQTPNGYPSGTMSQRSQCNNSFTSGSSQADFNTDLHMRLFL